MRGAAAALTAGQVCPHPHALLSRSRAAFALALACLHVTCARVPGVSSVKWGQDAEERGTDSWRQAASGGLQASAAGACLSGS